MDISAAHIIAKCGGPQAVADMLGIDLASVYKWKYPRSRGGADGRVPTGRQADLLKLARAAGIDLKPDDFFAGSTPIGADAVDPRSPTFSVPQEANAGAVPGMSASRADPADRTTGAAA